jgi:predicted transcriptional regulator
MADTITLRLDGAVQARLARLAAATGRTRSEIVRDALERQLSIIEFDAARRRTRPFAERIGWLTDDDVFEALS